MGLNSYVVCMKGCVVCIKGVKLSCVVYTKGVKLSSVCVHNE